MSRRAGGRRGGSGGDRQRFGRRGCGLRAAQRSGQCTLPAPCLFPTTQHDRSGTERGWLGYPGTLVCSHAVHTQHTHMRTTLHTGHRAGTNERTHAHCALVTAHSGVRKYEVHSRRSVDGRSREEASLSGRCMSCALTYSRHRRSLLLQAGCMHSVEGSVGMPSSWHPPSPPAPPPPRSRVSRLGPSRRSVAPRTPATIVPYSAQSSRSSSRLWRGSGAVPAWLAVSWHLEPQTRSMHEEVSRASAWAPSAAVGGAAASATGPTAEVEGPAPASPQRGACGGPTTPTGKRVGGGAGASAAAAAAAATGAGPRPPKLACPVPTKERSLRRASGWPPRHWPPSCAAAVHRSYADPAPPACNDEAGCQQVEEDEPESYEKGHQGPVGGGRRQRRQARVRVPLHLAVSVASLDAPVRRRRRGRHGARRRWRQRMRWERLRLWERVRKGAKGLEWGPVVLTAAATDEAWCGA